MISFGAFILAALYAATYSARIVHYFGLTGLCLGMLASLPTREESAVERASHTGP